MKKITILILSCFIVLSPLINIGDFSYADTQPSWIYVTQQDDEPQRSVVIAIIKAYLGARGYNNIFTYNAEKAIVQWSYNNWDNLAKSKGYNGLTDLNNHIAYRYNSNGTLQFFLDGSSIEMMNQIYTAILEYYNITENTNKEIYSGEYFEDDNNNGCYVFYVSTRSESGAEEPTFNSHCQKLGTPYTLANGTPYTGTYLYHNLPIGNNNLSISVNNVNHSYSINNTQPNQYNNYFSYFNTSDSLQNQYFIYCNGDAYDYIDGYLGVFKYQDYYYFGRYIKYRLTRSSITKTLYDFNAYISLTRPNGVNAAISAAQAGMNAGIVAAGKAAAISTGKEGVNALKDYLEDNDSIDDDVVTPVDDPTTPPDDIPSGGNPLEYNDTGGVLTPDGNGGFNFNFKMPQLNINWNLELNTNNLPFPFSIPSDFYKAFQAIDVEPEAPSFNKVIHLGFGNKWSYNWDFECDLSEIDGAETLANIHRKWFLFVYIVMLIIATRSVMHIY